MVDLEVVGRHALLFDDDANALFVNSEDALVDWNSLLIDRYDVRHLLSGPPPPRNRRRQVVPLADASIVAELDRERYLDLASSDEQEEAVGEDVAPVDDVGYRAVGFSYGNADEVTEQKTNDDESVYRPPFHVPESLIQNLPPTEKVHQIIARTATFVSKHGGQSEIVLRVKQGDNPTFGFLMPDHHLHPYFRFLVDHQEVLKLNGDGKQDKTGGDLASQTGGALSLLGSVYGCEEDEEGAMKDLSDSKTDKSQETVDTACASRGSEYSGNKTVKNDLSHTNVKEKVHAIKRNPSINSVKSVTASAVKRDGDLVGSAGTLTTKTQTPAVSPSIPKVELPVLEPPSELKRVVEKIVEFILRNGREFESVLADQDRKFGRFPFLLPSNQYHSYYLQVLQKTQESKSGKASVSEKQEPAGHEKEKKTSRRENAAPSSGTAESDLPSDYDRKQKFKMALGKPKKDELERPLKVTQPVSEVVIDAEVAAAILKAATRGIKDSGLELLLKPAQANTVNSSSSNISQTLSFSQNKGSTGEPSVSAPAANAMAERAARAAAGEADSSEASLTKEQKLKAERLKRAKMFAAMIRNGAAPLKPEARRSLSVEPSGSGVSSSGNEAVKPKAGNEREGSSVPLDIDTLEKVEKLGKKVVVEQCTERKSRSYRSRTKREEEEEEEEDDEVGKEDRRDSKLPRKKHRSHRSSRLGGDRHSHRKRHSSTRRDDEGCSADDEDRYSRRQHKHSSSDDDEHLSLRKRRKHHYSSSDDDEERHRSSRHRHKNAGSSDDDEDWRRSRSSRQRERGAERAVELEEGEICAKSDKLKTNGSRQASREASVDSIKLRQEENSPSRPSESTVVPDDLRAKIRAMLMATM